MFPASLTRKLTKDPLGMENDPLTLSVPNELSVRPSNSGLASPATPSQLSPFPPSPASPTPPSPSNYRHDRDDPEPQAKDLSFLLHPSFYLPISQMEVPPQFRVQLQSVSSPTSIPESLAEVEWLLSKGEFLSAAHLAAGTLTSPELDPTDITTISDLLSVRYSCLELTGNVLVAAQESKVLEDLNSDFYYIIPSSSPSRHPSLGPTSRRPIHILPFSLRLQVSRLQAIGFSDPRRGISALYDLGLECRELIAAPDTSLQERELSVKRLAELGIRVVNALVEINDMDCAKRTLTSLRSVNDVEWKTRMGLLLLKIGDVSAAKSLLEGSSETADLLVPLLATAEGRFGDAAQGWERLQTQNKSLLSQSIIQQNLAVNYLYAGRLSDAQDLLEEAVDKGQGYGTLTFNLATVYELSSEKSSDLKMALAHKVAAQKERRPKDKGKTNVDFKL